MKINRKYKCMRMKTAPSSVVVNTADHLPPHQESMSIVGFMDRFGFVPPLDETVAIVVTASWGTK